MPHRFSAVGWTGIVFGVASVPAVTAYFGGGVFPGHAAVLGGGAALLAAAAGAYTVYYNKHRHPYMIIQHADRRVVLPREKLAFAFEDVSAVGTQRLISGYEAEAEYTIINLRAQFPNRGETWSVVLTMPKTLGHDPQAIARRIAEELDVPLIDLGSP